MKIKHEELGFRFNFREANGNASTEHSTGMYKKVHKDASTETRDQMSHKIKSKIKFMICDWDETLAHTLPCITNAYKYVYSSLNMESKTPEEIKTLTSGRSKSEVFFYMLFGNDYEQGKTILKTKSGDIELSPEVANLTADQARENFYKYVDDNHMKDIFLMDGAKDFLEHCKNEGIKLYILSSKSPKYLAEETKALGIDKYFTEVYGSPQLTDNLTKEQAKELEKPSKGAFIALFKNNPPPAEECCVIGDGSADQTLANNIGCHCILINEKLGGIKSIKDAIKELDKINK